MDPTDDPSLATRAALLRRHGSAFAVARALRRGEGGDVTPGERQTACAELAARGLRAWQAPGATAAPILVARGSAPAQLGVAVVGARAADPYGLAVAARTARDAAALGRPVVSGGAEGCDARAHEAALGLGAPTVVVLGGGHDHPYHAAHRPLFEAVVAGGGAIVSPFWPPVRPARHRFLRRNEIIAALSAVVVVARARARSGALSTARAARALGRPVLAVPGAVGEGLSEGTNGLLARGEARAMTGPAALARALGVPHAGAGGAWPVLHRGDPAPWGAARGEGDGGLDAGTAPSAEDLGEQARLVLGTLGDAGALDLDALLGQTGLPVAVALAAVAELEVAGAVSREPGPRYRVNRRGGP